MLPVARVIGHKEYGNTPPGGWPGRKKDPVYDMAWRRSQVAAFTPRKESDMPTPAEYAQAVVDATVYFDVVDPTAEGGVRHEKTTLGVAMRDVRAGLFEGHPNWGPGVIPTLRALPDDVWAKEIGEPGREKKLPAGELVGYSDRAASMAFHQADPATLAAALLPLMQAQLPTTGVPTQADLEAAFRNVLRTGTDG